MDLVSLLGEGSAQGFVIGFVVGLMLKVASKAIASFLVVFFLLLKWLEARSIVIVDWHRMTYGVLGTEELVLNQGTELIASLIELGAFGLALVGGLVLAYRLGK